MAIASLYPTIKPSLLLDFANSKKLDPRVTFTRSTTAAYYDGVTTAKAEENLLLYSQQFNLWAGVGTTVSADATTAPDGTATADKIVETAATSLHYRLIQPSQTRVASYTLSVYAKAAERDWLILWYSGTGGFEPYAYFDLTNGVVGSASVSATASIQAAANGFYRCQITITGQVIVPSFVVSVSDADNNNPNQTYLGDATKGLFVWGAQLEQRSAATAYTPTTTQPITNYVPQLLTAPAGVPRFDHNPTTGESLGLLVEEQRTNLILQSEDFDTTWAETRATLTLNSVVAPNGTQTADQLIASTDNDTHFTTQTFTGTAVAHTFTVYAKASGLSHVALRLFNGTSQVGLAYYNLSTGVPGTVAAGTASMTSVGNGWYRCVLTATLAASASCTADIYLASADNTNSFAGNAFDGVTLWGAQLEAGAFPTSYIPTTSATVTRTVDAASMTGTNFSSWYNAGEGTLYAEVFSRDSSPNSSFALTIQDGTANERIALGSFSPVGLQVIDAGAVVVSININVASGTINKIAARYAFNDFNAAVNGTLGVADTNGIIPAVNQMQIGANAAGLAAANGPIKKLAYYPQAATNTQLQALTA